MKKLILALLTLLSATYTSCSDNTQQIPTLEELQAFEELTLHKLAFEKLKDPLLYKMKDKRYFDFFERVEAATRSHANFHATDNLLLKFIHNYRKDTMYRSHPFESDFLATLLVKKNCKNNGDDGIFLREVLKNNNGQIMEYLLSQDSYTTIQDDYDIMLAIATSYNNADKVLLSLMRAGAPINPEYKGQTPLCAAAENDADKAVALLLATGANVNAQIYSEPRDYAAYWNRKTNEPFPNCTVSPLHAAARHEANKVLPLLIDAGADLDQINSSGDTPLHKAVNNIEGDIYLSLILAGANINIKDANNQTARDIIQTQSPERLVSFDLAVAQRNHVDTLYAKSQNNNPNFSELQHYQKLLSAYQNIQNHEFTDNVKTRMSIVLNRIKITNKKNNKESYL